MKPFLFLNNAKCSKYNTCGGALKNKVFYYANWKYQYNTKKSKEQVYIKLPLFTIMA